PGGCPGGGGGGAGAGVPAAGVGAGGGGDRGAAAGVPDLPGPGAVGPSGSWARPTPAPWAPGTTSLSPTRRLGGWSRRSRCTSGPSRSEEHTSELQSLTNLVCRLLLEKKKKQKTSRQRKKQHRKQQRTKHTTQQTHST